MGTVGAAESDENTSWAVAELVDNTVDQFASGFNW